MLSVCYFQHAYNVLVDHKLQGGKARLILLWLLSQTQPEMMPSVWQADPKLSATKSVSHQTIVSPVPPKRPVREGLI